MFSLSGMILTAMFLELLSGMIISNAIARTFRIDVLDVTEDLQYNPQIRISFCSQDMKSLSFLLQAEYQQSIAFSLESQ